MKYKYTNTSDGLMGFCSKGTDGKRFIELQIGNSIELEENYEFIYLKQEQIHEKKTKNKHKGVDK